MAATLHYTSSSSSGGGGPGKLLPCQPPLASALCTAEGRPASSSLSLSLPTAESTLAGGTAWRRTVVVVVGHLAILGLALPRKGEPAEPRHLCA